MATKEVIRQVMTKQAVKVLVCDSCGAEAEAVNGFDPIRWGTLGVLEYRRYDLCPKCMNRVHTMLDLEWPIR